MKVPPLPELPEHAATGQIAEIYQDLRESLGIPNVNLVFRHMATVPGCLQWAWQRLAPLYRTAAIHEIAADLTAVAQPVLESLHRPAFGPSISAVAGTLESYIRANPINMVGLAALTAALDEKKSGAPLAAHGPPICLEPIAQILPMADLATLSADTIGRLRELARQVHGDDGPVIPSVFRHFAPWPAALDGIAQVVAELFHTDQLDRLAGKMLAHSRTAVARLSLNVAEPSNPVTASTIRMLADIFPGNMAKMTIVTLALRTTWCGNGRGFR